MIRYLYLIITIILFVASAYSQSTIDLSSNKPDNNINVPGTYLSLDTTGLNLNVSRLPNAFFNENDQTVFSVEQKKISIDEYESFISMLWKLESVIIESSLVFKEYTGKIILGHAQVQNINKEIWICYLGNKDFVIEIKAFYNSNLQSKYRKPFENSIKSLFIDESREMSIYEDLPFYLDENIFNYKKELCGKAQSITMSKDVNGINRVVTIAYFINSKEETEELKIEYTGEYEKLVINEKEIFIRINRDDSKITLEGKIFFDTKMIHLYCITSIGDESAISEFTEIAKSIEFK